MIASLIRTRDSVNIGGKEFTAITNNRCELRVQFGETRGVVIAIPGEAEIFVPMENVVFCRLIMADQALQVAPGEPSPKERDTAAHGPGAPAATTSKSQQRRMAVQKHK